MHDSPQFPFSISLRLLAASVCLLAFGCGHNPEGSYEGEITDWVKLVFESPTDPTKLVLTQSDQTDASGPAVLTKTNRKWDGTWTAELGKRRIIFHDKVYYLSKRAGFHELKAKDSGSDDEIGSPLTFTMNKGLSRRHSLSVSFGFKDDGTVERKAGIKSGKGTWETAGKGVVARFENEEVREVERFHFSWDKDDLLLRKITIIYKGKTQRMVYGPDEMPKFLHRDATRRD